MRATVPVLLAGFVLLTACSSEDGGTAPQTPGDIAGVVQTTTGQPLAGLQLTLLDAGKSTIKSVSSGADGGYRFTSLVPGSYFIRVPLPLGHAMTPAADTLRAVAVPTGGAVVVNFSMVPLTVAGGTVPAGATDTFALASGTMVILRVPAESPPATVELRDTVGFAPASAYPTVGNPIRLLASVAGSIVPGAEPVATISLPLPATTPASGGNWALYLRAGNSGTPTVEGFVDAGVSTRASPIAPGPGSHNLLRPVAILVTGLPLTASLQLQLVVAEVQNCINGGQLDADPIDQSPKGGRKALILVHGIDPKQRDCTDYNSYDPATSTFERLLPELRNDAVIRSGYKLYFYKYPTFRGIGLSGQAFAQALLTSNPALAAVPNDIVVIAHSMGGLVTRRAMESPAVNSAIQRVITLATPHRGTPNADPGQDDFAAPVQACWQQLQPPGRESDWTPWTWIAKNFLSLASDGRKDLWTESPFILGLTPPDPSRIIPLAGRTTLAEINRPSLTTWGLQHLGCILEVVDGVSDHDGTVPHFSAVPPELVGVPEATTFPGLDHLEMTGNATTPTTQLFAKVKTLIRAVLLPTVNGVTPSSGPTAGGTLVAIEGTNLLNMSSATIGGLALVNAEVLDASRIVGLTPPHSTAGPQDVVVVTDLGTSDPCVGCFAYVAPPIAPTSLIATTASSSQIDLAWQDQSGDETGFRIERCSGLGCTAYSEIGTVPQNAVRYSNAGLTAGASYTYRIRAYNASGASSYSNSATAVTSPLPPLPPTRLVAAAFSAFRIDLAWVRGSPDEDGVRVERCVGLGCTSFALIATLPAGSTGYQDAGLAEATAYTYRVHAFNPGGNSVYSNVAPGATRHTIVGRIAMDRLVDSLRQVVVLNSDGSLTQLTDGTVPSLWPTWAPDGSKVAFYSFPAGNADIFSVAADGTGTPTNLTVHPASDGTPAWSPDGSQIAFVSDRFGSNSEIFVMNADGSGTPMNVTFHPANDGDPAWSPDGSKIAFASNRFGSNNEIFVMNADGSGTPTNLSVHPANDHSPAWSPDGSQIAFVSNRFGSNNEIFVMNADGSGTPTNLSVHPAEDLFPAWSPDGTQITFVSGRSGVWSLYSMNADGSGVTLLLYNGVGLLPSWWGP